MSEKYPNLVRAWRNGDPIGLPIACNDLEQARAMFLHAQGKGYDRAEICERIGDTDTFRRLDTWDRGEVQS